MVLYIDLIIIINIIYDAIILSSVSILLRVRFKYYRFLLSLIVGLISLIFLIIKINNILLFIFKILISLIMNLICFGKNKLIYNTFYFNIISIILGGSIYLFIGTNIFNNLYIYLIISPLVLIIYIITNIKHKTNLKLYDDVIIIDKNDTYNLKGYYDTGNTLIDNILKLPVIFVKDNIKFNSNKKYLVPFYTLENNSLIECIKVDKVIIGGKKVDCLISSTNNIFDKNIDVILNEIIREMI